MDYASLGRTGLRVSVMGLGCGEPKKPACGQAEAGLNPQHLEWWRKLPCMPFERAHGQHI